MGKDTHMMNSLEANVAKQVSVRQYQSAIRQMGACNRIIREIGGESGDLPAIEYWRNLHNEDKLFAMMLTTQRSMIAFIALKLMPITNNKQIIKWMVDLALENIKPYKSDDLPRPLAYLSMACADDRKPKAIAALLFLAREDTTRIRYADVLEHFDITDEEMFDLLLAKYTAKYNPVRNAVNDSVFQRYYKFNQLDIEDVRG
ncbi:MAG: hypothetical protein HC892_00005 [Saprospiraceae bacterium]|nr:hypothetical protein [Saprospiraceae bacterium]